ncbi:hypothetical protein CDL12_00020 [Handroanthus impetiginosus]|uniref:Uncharacterized protein n=1 Tax=Handroanthus impetiginosus TaxID=429701 RepID=A0A2G9IBU8_9LAMI|nr:hypothetical protein CDL12_00020 [Handroanthus impetiginosus]
MRTHFPLIPFLFIMVILIFTLQPLSCRDIHKLSDKEHKSEHHSQFSWNFSAPAPKKYSRNGDKSNYTVSDRKTPGGPNPLHN